MANRWPTPQKHVARSPRKRLVAPHAEGISLILMSQLKPLTDSLDEM